MNNQIPPTEKKKGGLICRMRIHQRVKPKRQIEGKLIREKERRRMGKKELHEIWKENDPLSQKEGYQDWKGE